MERGITLRCRDALGTFWAHLTWAEISGALGDLGTFLPLLVGLVKMVNLDLGTTLLFTGIYNIITGMTFNIPMCVQPMKTIAAVALSEAGALTIPQIMAAGIFVSAAVLVLGVTGLMGLVTRLIPAPIIRGMQLGLGLNLALKGWQQVWYANAKGPPTREWWTIEGLFLGLFALIFIIISIYPRGESVRSRSVVDSLGDSNEELEEDKPRNEVTVSIGVCEGRSEMAASVVVPRRERPLWERVVQPLHRLGDAATAAVEPPTSVPLPMCRISLENSSVRIIPAALILVILGLILTMATSPAVLSSLKFGPSRPRIVIPSAEDWRIGILRAGLPQLPLTTLNSVLSVCQLAGQLFPSRPARPSTVAASVGAMNLVGCWFGAMPCCHGAGGLAGQVRFGARHGTAPIFLGIIKVVLALVLGSSLFSLLQNFPTPLLGAMLVFAGAELAAVARGQTGERGVAVMILTAAVVLAMNNVAIGVIAGLSAAYLLASRDWGLDTIGSLRRNYQIRN